MVRKIGAPLDRLLKLRFVEKKHLFFILASFRSIAAPAIFNFVSRSEFKQPV
jgi:hypothetical protein